MMAHLRTLVLGFVVLLYSLSYSGWVTALGLGELEQSSSLNEPFSAKVALLNVGDLAVDNIHVRLASKEDFAQVGAERELYLLDLRFSLDTSSAGKPFISVTSTKPIREPYLDFLIQLEWPSGRFLKEYTVFLDLPVFAGKQGAVSQKAASATASSSSNTTQKKKTTSASSQLQTSTRNTSSRVADTQSGSYRVQGGDTLWRIASNNRPRGGSVHQTMQAIYQRNGSAFVNGNMNLLKKGALLDIPGAAEVNAVDVQQANAQVASAIDDMQPGKAIAPELKSTKVAEPAVTETNAGQDGVLRLLAPGEGEGGGDSSGGTASSGSESATNESLENDLAIAQEGLSRSERENLDLQEKVLRLEEQVETMSRLLELEDDQLSAIQQSLAEDGSAEMELSAEALTDEELGQVTAETESELVVESEVEPLVVESEGEQIVADSVEGLASVEIDPVTAEEPVEVEDVPASTNGLVGTIKNNSTPIAAGLLLVVLGVLFLLSRNRKNEDEAPVMATDMASLSESDDIDTFTAEPITDSSSLDFELDEVDQGFDTLNEEGAAAGDLGEVDPIGEADIYLSFGDYDQAESIIRRALETQPDDGRLHLKLLELFADQNDVSRFDQHYPALLALGEDTSIQSAGRLREAIAGVDSVPADELQLPDQPTQAPSGEPTSSEEAPALVIEESSGLDTGDGSLELDLSNTDTSDLVVAMDSEGDLELDYDQLDMGDIELELDGAATISEFDDFDADADLDSLIDGDEITTQLELAQAYLDMGDADGAKDILKDVLANGNAEQQAQAQEILKQST